MNPLAWLADALGLSKIVTGLLLAASIATAIGGGVALIHHEGVEAGAASATAKAEKAHTARVAEARTDERTAQATADTASAAIAHDTAESTAFTRNQIEDLHHALYDVRAAPGASLPAAPVDRLRDTLNTGIDRANRAAEDASAAAGAGADGASSAAGGNAKR